MSWPASAAPALQWDVSRTLLAGIAAALASLALFAALAWGAGSGGLAGFDAAVREAVHAWASPRLTYAMRGITELGTTPCLVALGAFPVAHLWRIGRRRAALLFIVAVLGGQLLSETLKLLFHRARPEAFFGFRNPVTYSFPSGHAVAAVTFYGVLAAIYSARAPRRSRPAALWAAATVLSLLIGFSRIYLGVHYASDVIAGYAAAVIWTAAVYLAAQRLRRRAVPENT
jgi:undecaprenyl-diphosphatase